MRALALLLAAIAGGQLFARGHGAGVAALVALGVFGAGIVLGGLLLARFRRLLDRHGADSADAQPAEAPPRPRRPARRPGDRRRLLRDAGDAER